MVQRFFFVFRLHQKKDLQQCWSMHVSNPFSSPPTASSSGQQHPCGSNNQKKAVGCEAGRVAIESIILRPNAQQCPSGLSVRHTVINSYTVPVSGSTRDPTNQCMHASLDTTRRVLATYASSVSQSANQQPAITIHTSSVGFSSIFHDIQTTDIPSPVPSSASAVCILAHRAAVLSIRPSRPAHHSLSIPVNAIINIYPVMVTEEPTFFLSSASDSQPPIYIYIPRTSSFSRRTSGRVPSTHNLTIIGAVLTFSRALFEERVYGSSYFDILHCREKNRRAGAVGHTLSLSRSLSLEWIVATSLARCSNPPKKPSDTLISRLRSKLADIC
jgi:hypothetical protein